MAGCNFSITDNKETDTMFIPHAKAPAPTRSVGSITVSWGLLTIPLSVYVGSEETRIPRKEFVNGDPERPAGRAVIDKVSGTIVEADSIIKMAEAHPGVYVTLSDDEIKNCTLERGVAEIVSFVPRSLASGYVTEDIAQVRPQKAKGSVNAGVKMAFSLFVSAMASYDVYALVKFSLRGPARYGLITPTGDLLYVKTSDQVREALPLELTEVSEAHMALASQLIEAVGVNDPFIVDDTAPKVRALIMAKAGGVAIPLPKPLPEAGGDLMDSLMKSIEFAKAGKED